MPSIDIHRKHPHSLKRAKAAVNDTAAAMREKFDIESSWSGNTLNFSRAGVDGKIKVTADDIHVTAFAKIGDALDQSFHLFNI